MRGLSKASMEIIQKSIPPPSPPGIGAADFGSGLSAITASVGWMWAVTVAKVDDQSEATICDVVLLPGNKALLAPNWVPYSQRIQPGDLGIGDVVPTEADDERLTQTYAALPGE